MPNALEAGREVGLEENK